MDRILLKKGTQETTSMTEEQKLQLQKKQVLLRKKEREINNGSITNFLAFPRIDNKPKVPPSSNTTTNKIIHQETIVLPSITTTVLN